MAEQESKELGYAKSDMEVLFRRGDWRSWGDAITWLQERGPKDDALRSTEVYHMIADLRCLQDQGVGFTRDPEHAFALAARNCPHKAPEPQR